MKLISITTIKNEADIIESFIRYHAKIFDLMIILNNGSTDDSEDILNQLISEGLPVVTLMDTDKYFEPKIKYNFLLNKAFKEYGADIVCPLDADEFLTSTERHPRELLENLPEKSYFTVKWKTYIPTEHDDENISFVPSRIKYIRDEDIEHLGKVVVSKELFENYGVGLSIGNHNLEVNNEFKKEITNIKDSKLRIAHFPLRTVNQTMAKVLTNYPNSLSRTVVNKNTSYHYVVMFNKIKSMGQLEMSDVTQFAKNYSLRQNKGRTEEFEEMEINIYEDPMDLSFCKDIEMKYDYEENPLAIVLENNLYFAREIHNFKNEKITLYEEIQSLENEKINLNEEIHNLENEIKIFEDKNEEQQKEIAAKNELIEDVLSKTKKNIKSKDSCSDNLKKKMMDKALSKSNSYNYYRANFEKLSDDNEKLHDINVHLMAENEQYISNNKKLAKKNRKLRKKISKLRKNN